jgi:hypothetical protein
MRRTTSHASCSQQQGSRLAEQSPSHSPPLRNNQLTLQEVGVTLVIGVMAVTAVTV